MVEHAVELEISRVRVACSQCGPKLELLGWLHPYAGDEAACRERLAAVRGDVNPARGR